METAGRHVGNLVSRDAVNRLARFGAAVLLARALTLEDYGIVNTCIAAAGIALTATTLGLTDLGARDVAARPSAIFARGRLADQVLAARLGLLGSVSLLALTVIAIVSPSSLLIATLTVAMAMAMASNADWLLRGLERMSAMGTSIALGGLTALAGAALLAFTSGNATLGVAVILAGELVSAVASWAWAGTKPRPRIKVSSLKPLLARSWPLAISSLAMYVYYANLDTILLAATRSAEEAGLYSAPYRIFLALNAVAIYAAYSFMPMLTRGEEAGDRRDAEAVLRRGARYLVAYGAFILAGAQLLGGDVLGLLFGSEFEQMENVFVLLCLAIMWFSVGYPMGYALIAGNEDRRYLVGAATGGMVNLALNLVLIPPYGPIGAATATATAFVAACLAWLWGSRMLGRETALDLAAMALISLAAIAALLEPDLRPFAIAGAFAVGVAWGLPALRAVLAFRRRA